MSGNLEVRLGEGLGVSLDEVTTRFDMYAK